MSGTESSFGGAGDGARQPAEDANPHLPEDPNFMTSLARGLSVIRAFSDREQSLSISDVARITGLPRAAARRCLLTLQRLGYVGTDGRAFHLTPQILSLGYSYLSSAPLATTVHPALERVSTLLQESSSAGILAEDDVVYIARSATKRIMSVALNVGSRLPAAVTSMGRVLLAALPAAELDAFVRRVELPRHTERTITDRDALRAEIEATRSRGYALVDQELEVGLRSIAVPLRNASGAVSAAINVSTQAGRVGIDEMLERYLPVLRDAAEEIRPLLRL
ncbi:IclR family transcriptional regulator domain-containing protein [Arenibaculum pallidiluteum]|uniref:IclR family transcriptional regulator domain-containing protein n=1 Tax=Arenibaculum pallidiluteum TaxID=2812559 RepID=UPI002E2A755B|nr:IclR family transcriptional regulator C-terminal domain-containing protein [Arenibaculum pallidiluteum]